MIFVILLIALVLRSINLNQSLWLDEGVQAITAQQSFSYIFEELKGDFHPPLYHILMHFWVRIFGSREVVLRLPSVLFGIGTVYLIYKIGALKKFGAKRWGLISALFLATSQFHIYYSQEARMYALGCFLSVLSFYWWLKIINFEFQKLKIKTSWKIFYLIFTLFLLYVDYYGFFVLLDQLIGGLIIFRKQFKYFERLFFPLYLIIFLLYFPWIPRLVEQIKEGFKAMQNLPGWRALGNLNFWKALPLTLVKFSLGRIKIFNKKIYALVSLGLLGLMGWLGGWGFYKNYKNDKYKLILIWFLLPVIGAWLISLIIPNYQPFRLILVLPAFWLLLTKGILVIKNKKVKLAITGIFLGINIWATLTYWTNSYFQREDWRGVAEYLKKNNLPIIISSSTFNWPLIYYGVGDETIGIIEGTRELKREDRARLIEKLERIDEEKIAYTPYLADIHDREEKIPIWLEEIGFVKIEEVSFNQIPLFIYENRN